jgi:hypothetical protein
MSALTDFLHWFDGFADNIEQKPSAKQWTKIVERIGALKLAAEAEPALTYRAAPMPTPQQGEAPDPVVGGTAITARWLKQVRQELEEKGMDPESALEATQHKEFKIDLNADPKAVAQRVWSNGVN